MRERGRHWVRNDYLLTAQSKKRTVSPQGGRSTSLGMWRITDRQNIFYLHGALHVFDAENELKKYTWVRTGIRLIEQIRAALQANLYPLIVAEGQSQEKMARILHRCISAGDIAALRKLDTTSSSADYPSETMINIGLI